jgi:WhiB family redox-sensing transcriptional regulator
MSAHEYPDFFEKGKASCTDMEIDTFFPEKEDIDYRRNVQAAKKICGTCPYSSECLEWALKYEHHGIWGGLTPEERNTLKRNRRAGFNNSLGGRDSRR